MAAASESYADGTQFQQAHGLTGIFLSTGVQLIWEDDIFREGAFAEFGFSRRGFRRWLKVLGVPRMKTPGGKWLIDIVSLHLACRAVMRIGQPDFFCPGSDTIKAQRVPAGAATTLDPEYFREHWEAICAELLYAQRINWTIVTELHREAFNKAARRISLGMAQLLGEAHESVVRTIRLQGRKALNGQR